jgi:hypothetical protein
MKRLRVFGGVLGVAIVIGGLSFGDDPAPKYKGTLPPNWKKIGLDNDQVQRIYKIQGQYRGKIESLETQIRKLKDEERAEMEKVLTKAQKERLKEIRDKTSSGESGKDDKENSKDKSTKDKKDKN